MTTDVSGLELLTGSEAGELMSAVLATVGGEVLRWQPRQVDHQPGARTTVCYRARVRWADGSETSETLGACDGDLPAATARLSDGVTEIGMWRFPFDPDLPGLPLACDPVSAGRLAGSVGVGDGGPARVRLRAYRPRRRAVVEVRTGRGTVFVKVVRPGRVAALQERHRTAVAAGCAVPRSLGWTSAGLVLLATLPGRTLREALLGRGPVGLDPDSVVGLLDGLPAALVVGRRRETWGQKAPHYAAVLAGVAPEFGEGARAIAAAVDHVSSEGPEVAVHGDFYESQFMVRGGLAGGLLDIDTAGGGERLDDAACLLAHLGVLAQLRPSRREVISGVGVRLQRRFERDLPAEALRRRVAAVVLSLATGPYRVQEVGWRENTAARLGLARRWLEHSGG